MTWASTAGACRTWRSSITHSEVTGGRILGALESPDRPRLLFVTPVFPDTTGNGLAMRAGMFVEALAQTHRVTLLVLPVFGAQSPSSKRFCEGHCEATLAVEPVRAVSRPRLLDRRPALVRLIEDQREAALTAVAAREFDVIHAFRLYTAPLASHLARALPGGSPLHLDVDDIESATHERLAALHEADGLTAVAHLDRSEAARYRALERRLLTRAARLYACSDGDAQRLQRLGARDVRVVPNAVRPPDVLPRRTTSHPFTFLLIGTLDYAPNADAVAWFCREVAPIIRACAAAPFLVRVVGGGLPPPDPSSLGWTPELRLVGPVDDVAREYGEADAVIVPLRAGGGTRIKILEAFAYRRPVVSTTLGAEGIEARAGRDLLVGDTAEAFAVECLRLMAAPGLRDLLVANAATLLNARYTQDAVNRLVADWS